MSIVMFLYYIFDAFPFSILDEHTKKIILINNLLLMLLVVLFLMVLLLLPVGDNLLKYIFLISKVSHLHILQVSF